MYTLKLVRPFNKQDQDYPNSDSFMNAPTALAIIEYPDSEHGTVTIPNNVQIEDIVKTLVQNKSHSLVPPGTIFDGKRIYKPKDEQSLGKGVIK